MDARAPACCACSGCCTSCSPWLHVRPSEDQDTEGDCDAAPCRHCRCRCRCGRCGCCCCPLRLLVPGMAGAADPGPCQCAPAAVVAVGAATDMLPLPAPCSLASPALVMSIISPAADAACAARFAAAEEAGPRRLDGDREGGLRTANLKMLACLVCFCSVPLDKHLSTGDEEGRPWRAM